MTTNTTLDLDTPRFRSGVAARMARMPTSTLRIWERRYNVVNPSRSTAGQRLYSRRDVQRLVLLKALSERGHAIGAIAGLPLPELESIAKDAAFSTPPAQADSVIAIGPGWNERASAAREHRLWQHYSSATAAKVGTLPRPVDVLLVRLRSLHADAASEVLRIADRCAARSVVVAYSFGTQAAMERLLSVGVRLHREMGQPADTDTLLAQALYPGKPVSPPSNWMRAKRRFSDEQLANVARASSVVACECPRHVTDLIVQLSAFEDYSDQCSSRSPDDAILHRYLGDVANSARQLFEAALERLAEVEGLAIAAADPRERSVA